MEMLFVRGDGVILVCSFSQLFHLVLSSRFMSGFSTIPDIAQ